MNNTTKELLRSSARLICSSPDENSAYLALKSAYQMGRVDKALDNLENQSFSEDSDTKAMYDATMERHEAIMSDRTEDDIIQAVGDFV